jgi:hypothetical protein
LLLTVSLPSLLRRVLCLHSQDGKGKGKGTGAGAGSSSSSSSLSAASAGYRNEVNKSNSARAQQLAADITRFDAELAQWQALATRYLQEQQKSAGDGDGAASAAGASPSKARKRKAAEISSSGSAPSSAAADGSLDALDDGGMDEAYLAKYRLAGSLGDDVEVAVGDLINTVRGSVGAQRGGEEC